MSGSRPAQMSATATASAVARARRTPRKGPRSGGRSAARRRPTPGDRARAGEPPRASRGSPSGDGHSRRRRRRPGLALPLKAPPDTREARQAPSDRVRRRCPAHGPPRRPPRAFDALWRPAVRSWTLGGSRRPEPGDLERSSRPGGGTTGREARPARGRRVEVGDAPSASRSDRAGDRRRDATRSGRRRGHRWPAERPSPTPGVADVRDQRRTVAASRREPGLERRR